MPRGPSREGASACASRAAPVQFEGWVSAGSPVRATSGRIFVRFAEADFLELALSGFRQEQNRESSRQDGERREAGHPRDVARQIVDGIRDGRIEVLADEGSRRAKAALSGPAQLVGAH